MFSTKTALNLNILNAITSISVEHNYDRFKIVFVGLKWFRYPISIFFKCLLFLFTSLRKLTDCILQAKSFIERAIPLQHVCTTYIFIFAIRHNFLSLLLFESMIGIHCKRMFTYKWNQLNCLKTYLINVLVELFKKNEFIFLF